MCKLKNQQIPFEIYFFLNKGEIISSTSEQ